MKLASTRPAQRIALAAVAIPAAVIAAPGESASDWLPWVVLGAIGLFVAGIALRMLIAARFPKGYSAWAQSRRDSFAEHNAKWDRDDDARK